MARSAVMPHRRRRSQWRDSKASAFVRALMARALMAALVVFAAAHLWRDMLALSLDATIFIVSLWP